ncbi:ATP-binding protein [Embleya sp. NPDC001921]
MTAPRTAPNPGDLGRENTPDIVSGTEPMPLVERDFLQRELRDQLAAVRETGEGRITVVTGLAGMGKSAMLAWARHTAEAEGFSTLHVVGYDLEKVRVYGLVKRLFRDLRNLDEAGQKERLGEWYGILGPIFGLGPRQPGESPDPENVLSALDAVVQGYVHRAGPLIMVIDDVHWADPSSMSWLAQFAMKVRDFPILIVVSYRPDEYDPALEGSLRALDAVAGRTATKLSALNVTGTAAVIRHRFPDKRVDDAFAEHCHRYCGGEPQILRELLRFVESSRIEPLEAALPRHGAAMEQHAAQAYAEHHFKDRFSRLDPASRRLALAAAILTPHVTVKRAAKLTGLSESAIVTAADELYKQEILTWVPDTPSNLGFTHPLVRLAVYRFCFEPNERCAMHAAAARMLRADRFSAQTAATHALKMVGVEDEWAANIMVEAARECLASGVPEAGVTYLEHALAELAPRHMHARLYYNIGRALFVNDPPASLGPLNKALAESGEPGTELHTNIVVELGRSLAFSGHLPKSIKLLEREIEITPIGKRPRLYADLFMWAAFWEDDTGFASRAHNLQRLTVRLNTEGATTRTNYSLFALVAWYGVLTGRRLQTTTKFARAALGPEDPNKERPGFSWVEDGWGFEIPMVLTLTFIYCDLFKEAHELLESGMAELRDNGRQRAHLSYGHAFRAMLYYRMGRLKEAREQAETGLDMALKLGEETPSKWYAAGVLIQTLIALGDLDEAERQAHKIGFDDPARVNQAARVLPVPTIVLAELRLAQGRPEEVIQPLTELGERLRARGMDNPAWCPWGLLLAEALNAEGPLQNKKLAQEVARQAVARADTFYAPVAAGQAKRVAGIIEDNVNAQQALWDAAVALEGVGANYEYAKALLAYGDRLRKDGHKPDAIGELERARDTAMACGAIPLQTRAAEMVEALVGGAALPPVDHGRAEADEWVDEYTGGYSPFGIPHRGDARPDAEGDRSETWPFREGPTRRPEPE